MLNKHLTNVIQNLEKKKFREKYNLFKVEGEKLVEELLLSELRINTLIATEKWLQEQGKKIVGYRTEEISESEMKKISQFKSAPEVIALVEIPQVEWKPEEVKDSLSLLLNGIQDPGNLGTILRTCDWFGIGHIFCDRDCAGVYNPKTIQASMGAVLRVKVVYTELPELIRQYKAPDFLCYGTFLQGESVYQTPLNRKGFVVMGNEGSGISKEIENMVDCRLTIPAIAGATGAESLNVGVATGIVLSEFKRLKI